MTTKPQNILKKVLLIAVVVYASYFLSGCGSKKIVEIKYGDAVDISGWETLDTSKSSFIEGAWYDNDSLQAVIRLNGSNYKYCDFPVYIWNNFKSSESYGSYYNSKIKGNYLCNEDTAINSDDGFVFDHIIPLSLGGGDFSATSISNFKSEVEELPCYNESYLSCMYEAVKEETKMLTEAGYERQSDGSWVDSSGDYPSPELEMDIEIEVTKLFKSCIN